MKKLNESYVKNRFHTLGTSWWEPEQHGRKGEARIKERKFIIDYIRPKNKTVLDAAAGKGRFAIDLVLNGAKEVWAVDISPDMILEARRRCERVTQRNSINFLNGDVERMPFESDLFDVTLCIEAFVHLPNPRQALIELSRVTKRGGMVVADIGLYQFNLDKLWNYPLYFITEAHRYLRGNPVAPQYRGIHRPMSKNEFSALFRRADLKIVETREFGPPTYNFLIIASKNPSS